MSVPPDALALYAAVILLLPMACFFLSVPTFLLVGLEIPEVTQLLRGLFNGYFLVMGIAGAVAAVAFVVAGRPIFAVGAVAIAVFAIAARRWFLQRLDAALQARDAGVSTAVRRLRVLHLKGILVNAVQLAVVVASIPLIV
ncbi:MAG: hypothetical protein QOJ17_1990 [Rhodospirillaceae bacterium]|jgi:hypothetical protein|nr:hypothetical protein [Rhodospirillaceae bacterium]